MVRFVSPLSQGSVTVSLREGAILTEEVLVELAFNGKEVPPPLGFMRIPLSDVADLEQR